MDTTKQGFGIFSILFFWLCCMVYGILVLQPGINQPHNPCSESTESYPLDYRGIP